MTSLFVSHSNDDSDQAARIVELLKDDTLVMFVGSSPRIGIAPGREWEPELYRALRRSDAVVFVSTESARESKWCFAELAIARSLGKPILELRLDGRGHELLTSRQGMAWTDASSADEIRSALSGLGLNAAPSFAVASGRPAFPGLGAFSEEDAGLFFGRDDAIRHVLENLEPTSGAALLAVIGSSGSGKSSLVHAGVLPRIRINPVWETIAVLRSGERPLWHLALGLLTFWRRLRVANKTPQQQQLRTLEEQLRADNPDLPRVASELLTTTLSGLPLLDRDPAIERALIILDQAEELLTRTGADERDVFARILNEAAQRTRGRSAGTGASLSVLATLRTQSLAAWLEDQALAQLRCESVLIPPLSRDRLRDVIEGPARAVGKDIDSGVVASLVADTPDDDGLPLLAYALNQLESAADGGPITPDVFHRFGGVAEGVQRQADEALAQACRDPAVPDPVETLLELVTVDANYVEPASRRRALADLTEAQRAALEPFEARRLLVVRRPSVPGEDATIGVAHEALFRQWPPLRSAIEGATERLTRAAQLRRLAQDWNKANRSDDYLLAGGRLSAARDLLTGDRSKNAESPTDPLVHRAHPQPEWDFVEQSLGREKARSAEEANSFATLAVGLLTTDPILALRLTFTAAIEYVPTSQVLNVLAAASTAVENQGTPAEPAVHRILSTSSVAVTALSWAEDGGRIASARSNGSVCVTECGGHGESVIVVQAGRDTRSPASAIAGMWWQDERLSVATADNHGSIIVTPSGGAEWTLRGHEDAVWTVEASPDRKLMASAGDDAAVYVWDVRTRRTIRRYPHADWIRSLAWSPHGDRLASSGVAGTLRVWDLADEEAQDARFIVENAFAVGLAWLPDGRQLAGGSSDGAVQFWDSETLSDPTRFYDHLGELRALSWNRDGTRLATGGLDGVIRIWAIGVPLPIKSMRGHKGAIRAVAWSPDGTRLASGGVDGTLREWSTHEPDTAALIAATQKRNVRKLEPTERQRLGLPEPRPSATPTH